MFSVISYLALLESRRAGIVDHRVAFWTTFAGRKRRFSSDPCGSCLLNRDQLVTG